MYIHYDGKEYERVDAAAILKGSAEYPKIRGLVRFYQTDNGVYIVTSVTGLPEGSGVCGAPIFAMHIHEGASCAENGSEPFPFTGMHYNPGNCAHPEHAGDLPPLFGCGRMISKRSRPAIPAPKLPAALYNSVYIKKAAAEIHCEFLRLLAVLKYI